MLDAGVTLTVIECTHGDEDRVCGLDGVHHIPVRVKTRLWNKENLLNIGVRRTPEAKYIAWIDDDVIFHRKTGRPPPLRRCSTMTSCNPGIPAAKPRW